MISLDSLDMLDWKLLIDSNNEAEECTTKIIIPCVEFLNCDIALQ